MLRLYFYFLVVTNFVQTTNENALGPGEPLLKFFLAKLGHNSLLCIMHTVARNFLTYLGTLLTYRKLPFADKLWTLEKNKGHFIILELNSGIIKWPYFLPKVFSL